MATRDSTHTHRREGVQPADCHKQSADHHSDRDRARQARARLYRSKEATRYRHCEQATLAADDDQRTGPGSGDRQGEIA
ncbi:hypothetical protein [Halococcus sediminicola]|uniref:hypothetical protein n=1 Tax=Halococcus sediminicola TaxID=1264579 RepID=UPI0009ADF008|nr:hypothetical protein [Halococcus sediminicola]